MSWLRFNASWSVSLTIRRYILQHVQRCQQQKMRQTMLYHSRSGQTDWTSTTIRQTFLDFFKGQGHQHVPSSSVVPNKSDGTYFVNAGMNQFKPIFLGTMDPDHEMAKYSRAVNSQKCIRISGKHNDLSDVGRDTYHHTFFEMLGSWSFADYFKREACAMAWRLLTEVYHLSKERLYVTYFGGNEALCLDPDLECRDIWLDLGVSSDHILPCDAADNFWDMGDTGPCGPCTEIHYNATDATDVRNMVNTGHPLVVELWNLVFMQYDRQGDGELLPLPARHVDTGMGLERLTAVLQNKTSNYDTDLFMPLFKVIQENTAYGAYGGRLGAGDVGGRDTAYRIIADHARMFTVAISDGVSPGKHELEGRLRHMIHQALHQAIHVLELRPGCLTQLVPIVVHILGEAFPELNDNEAKVKTIIEVSEQKYRELLEYGEEVISKIISKSRTKSLTGEMLVDLQDGIGCKTGIPLNVSLAIAAKLNIAADVSGFNHTMERRKLEQRDAMAATEADRSCTTQDLIYLRDHQIPTTYSNKYDQVWGEESGHVTVHLENNEPAKVLALRGDAGYTDCVPLGGRCGLVVDRSPYYAEGGGQVADVGIWHNQNCRFVVDQVQDLSGYVVHFGEVVEGELNLGDILQPDVDMDHRRGCAVNHSATHLLNHALRQVADNVSQQGSRVTPHKLIFDFSCSNSELPYKCLDVVTLRVNQLIKENLKVYYGDIPLTEAKTIPDLTMLNNEVYLAMCRVVSVGIPVDNLLSQSFAGHNHSTELCGGCHVDTSGRIEEFVITHFQGLKQQGTKRVTAVTGDVAKMAIANADELSSTIHTLEEAIKRNEHPETWSIRLDHIEKLLFNDEEQILPKISRDKLISRIDALKIEHVNRQKTLQLQEELRTLLQQNSRNGYLIAQFMSPTPVKKIGSTMSKLTLEIPVMMFSETTKLKKQKKKSKYTSKSAIAVAYIPTEFSSDIPPALREKATASEWIRHLDTFSHGKRLSVGALAEFQDHGLHYINLLIDKEHPMEHYMELAKTYIADLKPK